MQFKCSQIVLIFTVLLISKIVLADKCPKCDTTESSCLSSITQKDCVSGKFIVDKENLCGCCPGCRGGITSNTEFCRIDKKCAPGLKCTEQGVCVLDKDTCSYTYHLKNFLGLPTCEIDGTFAAVQCKGDRVIGRCFCYSQDGERIHGWAWWRKAHNMTCSCSRLKHKLEKSGQIYNTLHCDTMGNFEPLQCEQGICWCADPKTGEVIKGTRAVPQVMWKYLPCYDIAKMGLQYLRQCESAAHAQHVMKKALFIHGTTKVEFNSIKCDYDGAYGIYLHTNAVSFCQWRDGTKIGNYQTPAGKVALMNCNCARDQKIFAEEGIAHQLSCADNGNYNPKQIIDDKSFCVDQDGFAVSVPIKNSKDLDCSKYLYYEAVKV